MMCSDLSLVVEVDICQNRTINSRDCSSSLSQARCSQCSQLVSHLILFLSFLPSFSLPFHLPFIPNHESGFHIQLRILWEHWLRTSYYIFWLCAECFL